MNSLRLRPRCIERAARVLMAPFVSIFMAACAPVDMLNLLVPDDTYRVTEDIAYGDLERQHLDVYVPIVDLQSPAPVIVFFYGGSWDSGSRSDYRFVGEALASSGFVAVVADYRLHPEGQFPGFVNDGAEAVAWTYRNIAAYRGDPNKIVLMGHSAGAHIAALLTLDQSYLANAHLESDVVKGFVGLSGPYSFDPRKFRSTRKIFAHLSDPNRARPVTFVRSDAPPMLLLHGEDDTTVGLYNSTDLAAALDHVNAPYQLKIYPDTAHVGIILALAEPFRGRGPELDDVSQFIRGLFADAGS